ncbi:unnamed protein product [Aureobasidium pullulans]|nr:unnamed protein product [Aureobasidium pullulans]
MNHGATHEEYRLEVRTLLGSDRDPITGLVCLALIQPTVAQYNRATSVEVNNGKPTAWWSAEAEAPSTSVFVASPLPTVFYNCHFAGSLCNNVELTQHGAHAGTIDMELVYDKDSDRRDSRRVDQPDVWVRDSTRNADGNRLRPNKISNKLQYNMGMNGRKRNYLIEDYSGTPSGLMYTCDEFPFAR